VLRAARVNAIQAAGFRAQHVCQAAGSRARRVRRVIIIIIIIIIIQVGSKCRPCGLAIPYLQCYNKIPFTYAAPSKEGFSHAYESRTRIEQIELQAKLLNYFLGSNKSNINQSKKS